MKINNILLSLLITSALFLPGCSKAPAKDDTENKTESVISSAITETEPESDASVKNDFTLKYINTGIRPIAVMVDNDDKNARPQAGLEDAYLIYEMPVEGGATRFMALFQSAETEKIGPVRSSRHYFLDYAMENDAIYTHFGWSPKAMQDISAYGINKINGILGEDGNVFWREEKYRGDWHSAYTSIANIKSQIAKKGFETQTQHEIGLKFADEELDRNTQSPAHTVSLNYSSRYHTSYAYNSQAGMYEKSIGAEPHVMQSGETLAFKNIIIELIYDTALGDGSARRDIRTAGSGKGYYISNGQCEEITWSKPSRNANTVYTTSDGTELMMNPGKTVINIISPAAGITIS